MNELFYTLEKNTIFVYKNQNSKFYSFIYPVSSIDEIKTKLNSLKDKYSDSSHICYAYRLFSGYNLLANYNTNDFSTDAGEPRGSSGPPILKVLKRYQMINVAIFVVRYFGGRKLGIPGLIEAYTESAEGLINKNMFKVWFPIKRLEIHYSYSLENSFQHLMKSFNIKIHRKEFKNFIILVLDIKEEEVNDFKNRLSDYSSKYIKII